MTKQEIKDLIAAKIAGQGTMVDLGSTLPTILEAIMDLAPEGGSLVIDARVPGEYTSYITPEQYEQMLAAFEAGKPVFVFWEDDKLSLMVGAYSSSIVLGGHAAGVYATIERPSEGFTSVIATVSYSDIAGIDIAGEGWDTLADGQAHSRNEFQGQTGVNPNTIFSVFNGTSTLPTKRIFLNHRTSDVWAEQLIARSYTKANDSYQTETLVFEVADAKYTFVKQGNQYTLTKESLAA